MAVLDARVSDHDRAFAGMVAAFGGGAALSGGVFTAPTYVIRGGSYSDAGSAFAAVDSALSGLDSRVSTLEALPPGGTGAAGASAYDIAVAEGFSGTEQTGRASVREEGGQYV